MIDRPRPSFYISGARKTQSIHMAILQKAPRLEMGGEHVRQELKKTIVLFTKEEIQYKRPDIDGKLAAKPFTKPTYPFEMLYRGGK